MALDHYVSQVHLKQFFSPALGSRLYATKKSDLKSFQCHSKDVCRIEEGSTCLLYTSGTRNGLHRWFPVAMVTAGPKDGKQGLFTDIDLIRLRRIHTIRPDGSISRL